MLATDIQSSSLFSGMSYSIENDLSAATTAATVLVEIKGEVYVVHFSWQVDETTDSSCHAQMSVKLSDVDIAGLMQ